MSFQMLTVFSRESMLADARAFRTIMKHIHEMDAAERTVITVHIETEKGLYITHCDYCETAYKASIGRCKRRRHLNML
ncbi:MAG: hypothetical protein GT597_13150 [Bacteroidales bacterium]|nr:hypothetical protein [Bacteroidales bacterium]